MLSAPRLSDDIWLYGGDLETAIAIIANGRLGIKPAFDQRLGDTQIKFLVAVLLRRQPIMGLSFVLFFYESAEATEYRSR